MKIQQPARDVFESWNMPPLELETFRSLDRPSAHLLGPTQAQYLLGFSLLAPSTHNTVPQAYRVNLERDRIELCLRRRHVLAASDPNGREALASVGCAVENLALAAAQYGIGSTWEPVTGLSWSNVSPSPSEAASDICVGWLQLCRAEVPHEASRRDALRGMLERRTVRAEFDGTEPLPPELCTELLASTGSSVRLLLFESAAEKFAWGKLEELATKHKLEEGAFRRELGEWLLTNDDEHSARGMRGREFGLDDRVTRELSARLRGEAPMPVDQLAFMARAGRNGLCSASAVCALSCLDPSPATAIVAGRVFQRCVLLARRCGFVSAVHTAVCHVPHARAMSQATLMKSLDPSMIFRLGKPRQDSDVTRAHSSRPRLEDLLIGANDHPAHIGGPRD